MEQLPLPINLCTSKPYQSELNFPNYKRNTCFKVLEIENTAKCEENKPNKYSDLAEVVTVKFC